MPVIPFPVRSQPSPAVPADPAMKRIYWAARAWAKADRAGQSKEKAADAAFAAPTPGEAEILKLLRRLDRRLATLQKGATA